MKNLEVLRKNISKAIRFHRKKKGFSQFELAERSFVSASYISDIETGKRMPSIYTLIDIAKALDIDVWDLLIPVDLPENIKFAIKSLLQLETSEKNNP